MRLVQGLVATLLLGASGLGCGSGDDSTGSTLGTGGAITGPVGSGATGGGSASGGSIAGGNLAGGTLSGGGALPGGSAGGTLSGGGSGTGTGTGGNVVTGPASQVCATQVIDAYGTVPDMLIVLDRSQSMSLYNRWEPSKQAVKTITSEFEGLLAFGLEYFPGDGAPNIDVLGILGGGPIQCSGGEKLNVPIKLRNAMPIAQTVDRLQSNGLTPTGAALDQALMVLGDRRQQLDMLVKPGYVLLVTDGDPSCDPTSAITGMGDMAQQDAARAAVKALKDKGIPTYVIGYQIDAARQGIMNELAMLGGTMQYHPVESADQIVAAFRQITKDVIKCTFDLKPTDNKPIDPKYVRVQIDKISVPLNAADGWVINGNTITLQGGACATLKDGKGHNLNAQVECTEVVLN